MKVTFDIECTPEEARAFLGLPNIAPLQDRAMKELETRMVENIRSLDPETFVKTWFPASVQGWNDLQKMFWGQMSAAAGAAGSTASTAKTGKAEDKSAGK